MGRRAKRQGGELFAPVIEESIGANHEHTCSHLDQSGRCLVVIDYAGNKSRQRLGFGARS